MGALGRITGSVPNGWADEAEERIAVLAIRGGDGPTRAWRLWLEAQRAMQVGNFALAHRALDAADHLAEAVEWTPTWGLEARGLRAKLLHSDSEAGQAYEMVKWAMQGWLLARQALSHPEGDAADFAAGLLRGAHEMVTALVPAEQIDAAAHKLGATRFEITWAMWLADRLHAETVELVARALALEGQVSSYAAARQVANDVLAAMRSWDMEQEKAVSFEAGLRLGLATIASRHQSFAAAVGQADDGLALVARLSEGPDRARTEAELRSNRAAALYYLGRYAEAAAEAERARTAFAALGATSAALRLRFSVLRAREGMGIDVHSGEVGALVAELEAQVKQEPTDGDLQHDLEGARRWWLSTLADDGTPDIEQVIGIVEVLRDDQPALRAGTIFADPVVRGLCRPFTVLGQRLRALDRTALVVLEPGIRGDPVRPPLFLVIASEGGGRPLRWHLVPAGDAGERLQALGRVADDERGRLLTGEVALHGPPSPTLEDAAAAAWNALPAVVADTLRDARTVLYMPSALNLIDTFPFELLRHEDGWLGTTHVIARCPSFQLLEELLAPNGRTLSSDARAVVACAREDAQLGVLAEAEGEADLAVAAASLLGLNPQRRDMTDHATVLDTLTGGSLVHYIGHGFASTIGEVLPISTEIGVSAFELADHDGSPGPFVFFSACLLGRIRHVSGGRQKGWALRLLNQGTPAVVGALTPVPDAACVPVAKAFYRAVRRAPVGEAMRAARAALETEGVHPLVWGAYVLHGDPNATLSGKRQTATADLVRRWPALATRFLATRLPEDRKQLVAALAAATDVPPAIVTWAATDDLAEPALVTAVDDLLDRDPEASGVCRILLALARLQRDPDVGDELDAAWLTGDALQDGFAKLHVIDVHGEAMARRNPELRQVWPSTVQWLLATLGGARGQLADLALRTGGRAGDLVRDGNPGDGRARAANRPVGQPCQT
jgi:hypothetical protein